jgi:hypothetical protein
MKNYWLGDWPKNEDKEENEEVSIETSVEVVWAGHKVEIPN